MIYHPKGEMCMSCKHLEEDCSYLRFNKMYVIEKYEMNQQQYSEVACNMRIPVKNVS